MTGPEIRPVEGWHEALNGSDADGLVALSHPEIEVGGPRGSGRGAQLLREWVARANVRLEPRRVFALKDRMVVEQWARWRSDDTGEATGSRMVASVFVVRNGKVTSVLRYDTLADALVAADLDGSHETGRDLRRGEDHHADE